MPDPQVSILINAVDKTKATLENVKKGIFNIDSATAKMAKAVSLGVVAFKAYQMVTTWIKDAYKATTEFNYTVAQVNTLLDDAGQTAKIFSDQLRAMAKVLPVKGVKDLADGLYQVISATISAADAMDVLEVSAKAAIAGITDTRTSVDAITTVIKGFGLEATEAEHVADVFFQTVKRGKTTFGELAPSIGSVVAMANQVNISFEDVGASIAVLTQRGIQTSEAITDLTALITAFLKPTTELNQLAKDYGYITAEDMLRVEGLSNTLKILVKNIENQNYEVGQLLGRKQAIIGFYTLTADSMANMTREQELMTNSAGVYEDAYSKMANEVISKTQLMKNQWEDISISFTESVLVPVVNGIYTLTQAWGNHETFMKTYIHTGFGLNKNLQETKTELEELGGYVKGGAELYKQYTNAGKEVKSIEEKLINSKIEYADVQLQYNESLVKQSDLLKEIPKLQRGIVESDRAMEQSALGVHVARDKLVQQMRDIENRPRTLAGEERRMGQLTTTKSDLEEELRLAIQQRERITRGLTDEQRQSFLTATPEGIDVVRRISDLQRQLIENEDDIFYQQQRIVDAQQAVQTSYRDTTIAQNEYTDAISTWKDRAEDATTAADNLKTKWDEVNESMGETKNLQTMMDDKYAILEDFTIKSERLANRNKNAWEGVTGEANPFTPSASNPNVAVNVFVDSEQIAAKVDKKYISGMYPGMEW